jgi:BirA family biotin operon repressor/biotin-[acetyl-CoA-carboxylase] ligase
VLEALVRSLDRYYQLLQQANGREEILREWSARSSYFEGRRIRVIESNENLVGTTRGLENDGALRLETDEGEIRIVRAGDVTAVRPVTM